MADPSSSDQLVETAADAVGEVDVDEGQTLEELYLEPGMRIPDEFLGDLTETQRARYFEKVRREEEAIASNWDPRGPQNITGENWWDEGYSSITGDPFNARGEPDNIRDWRDREGRQTQMKPRYSVDYPRNQINRMTAGQLEELEMDLWRAGYLQYEPGDGRARRGELITGFTSLVNGSDMERNVWQDQLERDVIEYQAWLAEEEKKNDETTKRPFNAPNYLAPDYATLAQKVKGSIRGSLQRNPTSAEMSLLTDQLSAGHRKTWEARELNPAVAEHNEMTRYDKTEEDQGSLVLQDYDYEARYAEQFDERYSEEMKQRRDVDQTQRRTGSLFGSVDMISRNI